MKEIKKFEDSLVDHLKNFDLKKDDLKKYSKSIVELRSKDIFIDRVYQYGKPAENGIFGTNGIDVKSRIGMGELDKLLEILQIKGIHSIKIFPLGIINPDFLDVQFRLGNQVDGF